MNENSPMPTQDMPRTYRRRSGDVPDGTLVPDAVVATPELASGATTEPAPAPPETRVPISALYPSGGGSSPRLIAQYLLARLFGGHDPKIPLGAVVDIESMDVYKPFADTEALEDLIKLNVLARFDDNKVGRSGNWDRFVNGDLDAEAAELIAK